MVTDAKKAAAMRRGAGTKDFEEPKATVTSAEPPRNFTITTEERIRAITIGAPAFALRKRHIEDLDDQHVAAILAVHDKLAENDARAHAIEQAMLDKAKSVDLKKINALVESHNRYYPIEANLPIDPKTGGYLIYGRRWLPEEPWTAARLLERARAILDARSQS